LRTAEPRLAGAQRDAQIRFSELLAPRESARVATNHYPQAWHHPDWSWRQQGAEKRKLGSAVADARSAAATFLFIPILSPWEMVARARGHVKKYAMA